MKSGALKVFQSVRTFSSLSIFIGILLSLILRPLLGANSLGWQIVIATIALAIGIPHGAVDHLIAIKESSRVKLILVMAVYVAIAVLAAVAIFHWNAWGFRLVLVMSFLHFGFGDAAFINELDKLASRRKLGKLTQTLYALSAGSIPVLIPLTQKSSTSALSRVHSDLISWAGNLDNQIRLFVLLISIAALGGLALANRYREISDLLLLGILALVAPPLVAFAVYFGCWHAIRHTARLTLLLPKSISFANSGEASKSFWAAVLPGLPALLLTLAVAVLTLAGRKDINSNYFWTLLVIVWALTVPHMMVTARIDKKALN